MIKELEANVKGMKKMAEAYKREGGFKEVAEMLAKYGETLGIPEDLLREGREAELEFAEITERLGNCYEKLLEIIKEGAGLK